MSQRGVALQVDSSSNSICISPIVKLARCTTTEETLEHLAGIVTSKGITLRAIRLLRQGLIREWKPKGISTISTDVHELEAHVEGGSTRIVLVTVGNIRPELHSEVESAAYMAAQRVELCERKLWSGKEEAANQPTFDIDSLIGNSEPMRALKRSIRSAAGCNSTTLIIGESGTGKELAARAIHNLGSRADKPFVAINCGAFAESLLESELFGYVKGAFTGAVANRKGLFEAANGGTIFLDEIGEMPLAMQVKILRVLQERKVRPIGAHNETDIDVRVIAATNRDLRREAAEKRFREDLFYRLHVLVIRMPSLRERRGDLYSLVPHFLSTIRHKLKRSSPIEIEDAAMLALRAYHWPGNVRELENTLERLVTQTGEGNIITVEQVSSEMGIMQFATAAGAEIEYTAVLRAGESLDDHFSRQQLKVYELVRAHVGGNHSQAARWLGMERTALYHRLERARQRAGTTR
jgi:transcriptional regulator with PAS, ATPase and Fis domain